jgi:hypothetical protein
MSSVPMPVRIRLDHPDAGRGDRLKQALGRTTGALLVLVGLVATVAAVPLNFLMVGFVLAWASGEGHEAVTGGAGAPTLGWFLLAWAISTATAIAGLKVGLSLVRRNRGLVLFLRRFGHEAATRAVGFAVRRTMGSTWRLATLEDAAITPIGLPDTTRRLFRVGGLAWKTLSWLGMRLGLGLFPAAVLGAWAVVGVQLLVSDNWKAVLTDGTLDRYFFVLGSMMQGRPPLAAIEPSLVGVFALLVIVAAASFAVMGVVFVACILALPLAAVLAFVSAAADAVRAAEQGKRAEIRGSFDVPRVTAAITAKGARVLVPRLTVVRVAPELWQEAVRRLAAVSSLLIVDISEPTENVLWEMEELVPRFGRRCVLIGEYDRVRAFVDDIPPADGSPEERMLRLMAGRDVLAYVPDRRGLRRFARALRSTLSAVSTEAGDRPLSGAASAPAA